MGASNCPETPRQKMIGMMYLVLTAMLALNVSKEIINTFATVGDAMQQTNDNFNKKIDDSYRMFDQAYAGNPEKVEENYQKAQRVRTLTKELSDFIDNTKYELVSVVEGSIKVSEDAKSQPATPELAKEMLENMGLEGIQKKDDYSKGTLYFCGNTNDGVGAKATELKNKIEDYKSQLREILGEEASSRINLGLETNGDYHEQGNSGKKLTWEAYNFYHTIAVADVVILNRLKSEVLNAEFDVVNHLYRSVSADDFKFSQVTAKVIPTSRYVLQGNNYEAEAIVAAFDEKANFDVIINGQKYSSQNGVVPLRIPARTLGRQVLKGTLHVKKESGEETYPIDEEFTVIPPTAVVSLTQMNVFYVGVDNPVSISVPMVDARDITVSFDDASGPGRVKGTIKPDPEAKGAGNYIVNVPNQGRTTLNIYTKIDGRTQLAGKKEYRCKSIPVPSIEVGSVKGSGVISKDQLIAAQGFRVRIPDFDFQIPALRVNSFSFEGINQRGEFVELKGTGNRFTPEMMDFIRRSRAGQRLTISDVRVSTPDGKQHNLSANLIIR